MSGRFITALRLGGILLGFPLLFLLLTRTMQEFFVVVDWEDAVVAWIDQMFNLPSSLPPDQADGIVQRVLAGGARRWLVDLSTLPFLIWVSRFLGASLEEVRYTHDLSTLQGIEIIFRWLAVCVLLLFCAPILAATLYHTLRLFQAWEPLVFLFSLSVFLFLCCWSWQYPDRRLKHVEKAFHFETLKR